jgi:predicted GNAT family acetyltransferase
MSGESDFDVLIRTGLTSPIAISLAESLLAEARIPFFTMDQNPSAREILSTVEAIK